MELLGNDMGTPTYTALANLTLSSSAASVTFSSISQAYRDLVVVINGTTSANASILFTYNSDTTATNYNWVTMFGTGTSAVSSSGNSNNNIGNMYTSLTTSRVQIMDYSATDKHKSALTRVDNAGIITTAIASRWSNTAAITTLGLTLSTGGSFASGSSFALYGIAA